MATGKYMSASDKILHYFADPMCSWCWGFSPVIEQIRSTFGKEIKISLVLGGLRPGSTDALTPELREEILEHWHQVHERCGQTFTFEGAMPEGFVYDTEPPSRAVVSMGMLQADKVFDYFKSIQQAFYVEQKDVTRDEELTELARSFGVSDEEFLNKLNSAEMENKTQAHFHKARLLGVRGFPSLIMQEQGEFQLICNGYKPFDELEQELDQRLRVV